MMTAWIRAVLPAPGRLAAGYDFCAKTPRCCAELQHAGASTATPTRNLRPIHSSDMTDEQGDVPTAPDWTRTCTGRDLDEIQPGQSYMLRLSDEPDSPWRHVKGRRQGNWIDKDTGQSIEYMTVSFHNDDSERVLNETDEIEVGLFRPADWPNDMDPPEWPRRD